jgi:hypothetical protein
MFLFLPLSRSLSLLLLLLRSLQYLLYTLSFFNFLFLIHPPILPTSVRFEVLMMVRYV